MCIHSCPRVSKIVKECSQKSPEKEKLATNRKSPDKEKSVASQKSPEKEMPAARQKGNHGCSLNDLKLECVQIKPAGIVCYSFIKTGFIIQECGEKEVNADLSKYRRKKSKYIEDIWRQVN